VGLTFEHPGWLFLLLLAIPVAWAGLRWFAPMSMVRRWSAVAIRVLLIALVSAMLAGASSVRRTDRLAVVAVVDVSQSVRMFGDVGVGADGKPLDPIQVVRDLYARATSDNVNGGAGSRGPDDLAGIVVFDGRAAAIATPTRASIGDRSLDVKMADGTDIAGALRYAAALIPPDASGRLLLFSDGNQTTGDAAAAARGLVGGASRLPIDVVPIPLAAGNEVMVESVDTPPRAAAESTITVRVTLTSSGPATGSLSLLRENQPLDINGAEPGFALRVALKPGRNVELITVPLPPGTLHRFTAIYEPTMENGRPIGDRRPENNRAEAFTVTPGKGSVLLVDGVGHAAKDSPGLALADTLRRAGIEVTAIPPEGIPQSILALGAYDLVILENVPAEAVPQATQEAMVSHVKDVGAGLVMIGGPDSFGAGGWKGSAIEPILPVKLDLPEQLVQPDAAVVFIIDNSGSMGRPVFGTVSNQQEIANQAVALAVRTLDKKDLVSVVVFNSTTDLLVPLSPNTDPQATAEKVLSITPGGGTILAPALEEARDQLKGVKAAVKHVIVLSDGQSLNASSLPGIAGKMKSEDGITVSTIGVGNEMDEDTMGAMAQRGGGQFYAVSDPSMLPKYFLKAIRIIRTPLIREGKFQPVILPVPSPLTADLGQPPPLTGLILTQRRPEATITYAMAAPTGEPLLAHWNVELGQVVAFTSDAHHWAAQWLDGWPGYSQFWTQVARTAARVTTPGRMDLTTTIEDGVLKLHLDAADESGRPLDLLTVPATIYSPSNKQIAATLTQTGPGTYDGSVPAPESGSYIAIVKPRTESRRLSPVIGGASAASGLEFRSLVTNTALLEAIAQESGGRFLNLFPVTEATRLPDLFDRAKIPPSTARTPLRGPLLLWSLLILLMDVATRRIAWDRFVSREFGVDLRKSAAEAVRERGHEAAATVSRLRDRDEALAAGASTSAALSDEDAQRVADAERERRRRARMAAVRTSAQEAAATEPAQQAPASDKTAAPPPAAKKEDGSSLLAAKQRAKERFGDEDQGPSQQR
jgi:uncharacterized membrane protein